jgi:NADH-quinone oxidoreductase subunit G
VEEQFLLKRIRDVLGDVPVYMPAHLGEGDGKLLSADRTPNTRGALLTGLTEALPKTRLSDLAGQIENEEVNTVLAVSEDIVELGIDKKLIDKIQLVYAGCHHNECVQYSAVELPMLTSFEKSGTFVNQQFRLQKFNQAVPGPATVLEGLGTLAEVLFSIDPEALAADTLDAIWENLSAEVPEFAGIAFDTIPETGTPLDGSRFAGLPFPEGKGLHFNPEPAKVEA